MCQTRAQGGRRCLKHAGASVAEVHFSWAKTGVDKETIYATLKELNKEGRKLEAPELAEVKAFLKKEEFVVKHDPDLSERDRKLILKNLAKANDEAEKQSVSGGAFHAWKNIFSKTVEKIKKPLVAAGLVGVLAFSMAGCSGSLNNNNPDGTSSPSPTSSPSEIVECSTDNPGPYGDVIAKEEVTDEYGEYCRTTIDPKSDALKYDASKTDMAKLTENGFTEEDAKKAQVAAVTYLAEETLDSTRLDNYSQSAGDWYEENASYFSNDSVFKDSVKASDSLVTAGLVVTDYMPTPIVRNGDPRSTSTNIQVNSITAGKSPTTGESVLVVVTGANANYDAKNADVVALILKNDSSITEESLKAEHPELFLSDKEASSGLFLQGSFTFGFDKDNVEKINGANSTWTVSTVGGVSVVK